MATPTVTKKTRRSTTKKTTTDGKSKAANDKRDEKPEIVWSIKPQAELRKPWTNGTNNVARSSMPN